MPEIEVALENPQLKTIRWVTLFMNIFALAQSVVFFMASVERFQQVSYGLAAISAAAGIMLLILKKRAEWALIGAGLFIVVAGSYFDGLKFVGIGILGLMINKPLKALISEAGIRYTSFPVRNYVREEIHDVVVNDGLLSVELNNGKYLQHNITGASPATETITGLLKTKLASNP